MTATVTAETILAMLSPQARAEYDQQIEEARQSECLPAYDVASIAKGIERDLARAARTQVERTRVVADCRQAVANASARRPATSADKAYPELDDAWRSLRSAATLRALGE